MSSEQAWKSLLGFTERFSVIDQIASLLKQEHEVQNSQAFKAAQVIETACFNIADSEEDYIRSWKAKLAELKSHQHHLPPPSPPFSPPTPPHGPSSSTSTSPGITLGAYTSCHPFASGLFSTVYKAAPAVHLPQPTFVALKHTHPTTMTAPHDSRREARILAKLLPHPNLTPLLETFTLPPSSFTLVFPFLPYTLDTLLTSNTPAPPISTLLPLLRDTASALSWVHAHGILHRDVKPSNILLRHPGGPALLGDFGIAYDPADPGDEGPGKMVTDVGTTCYRPPELLFGHRAYGTALDMWAYGCTIAECVLGEQLFDAGELGSELALVGSIFRKLGTPGVERWPEAGSFPDFGKMLFHQFPPKCWEELLPAASDTVRDLVGKLLVYESRDRLAAEAVLEHEVFRLEVV